ncbi:cadherin EGF LAG seven-pass G-type receptor 3-like isoform X1 [Dreissena polymorpha]|uniref:cadherin EGF LAG seven-pass G-type receptor 3-like isoform X1 n=1 Tax=Dreissena polymorpha TaxID=45954 RepID=UPI002265173C|nr:cadherin EGF LAG seven-pass G-type receptor 3-like isoform X1 [Dreissena polymorpha]
MLKTTVAFIVAWVSLLSLTDGKAVLEVTPNPGAIYHGAEPGEPVLRVTAYDNVTDDATVGLSETNDASYFELVQQPRQPKEFALNVKLKIDKPVGYVFKFVVYIMHDSILDQTIVINVTEKNAFTPTFDRPEYTFIALRNGAVENLAEIGTVHASDADEKSYNNLVNYHILDSKAGRYIDIGVETGMLELIDVLPADRTNITFNVTAIDGGSPQKLSSVRVVVRISDLKPPDTFCVAVDEHDARVCWKDPTNGSYVMKYELTLQMDNENATQTEVKVDGVQDETCTVVPGEQLGKNYTFTVRIFNALEESPESLQRKVRIAKKGMYGDCTHFTSCSILQPCKNGGECLVAANNSYTCNCSRGFGGMNCTGVDHCATDHCKNGGTCTPSGNGTFTCQCPADYVGTHCEIIGMQDIEASDDFNPCFSSPCDEASDDFNPCFSSPCDEASDDFNPCFSSPCDNNGTCLPNSTGFRCQCGIGFGGTHCQNKLCANQTCWNNASCYVINGDAWRPQCECPKLFYGENCEFLNFCMLDDFCHLGVNCNESHKLQGMVDINLKIDNNSESLTNVTVKNLPNCVCGNGSNGRQCEILSPCALNPCGSGKCVPDGQGHVCTCLDKTQRINCDPVNCSVDPNYYDKTGRYVWPETAVGQVAQVKCRLGAKNIRSFGYAVRNCTVRTDGTPVWETPITDVCIEFNPDAVSANLRSLAALTRDASGLHSDEIANITTLLEEFFYFSVENHEIAVEMTMVVGNLLTANESVIIESNSRNHSSERLLWLLDEYVSKVATDSSVTIETENINLQVVNHTRPDLGFTYSPKLTESDRLTSSGISLILPSEALTSSTGNSRIQLMTFRSSSFFIPLAEVPPQDVVLRQRVVSAVINGRKITNLSTPVEIKIQNIQDGENHTCVYWDERKRAWSTEGMVTFSQQGNQTHCLSHHLTSFAILLDPSPDVSLNDHERILTYISYIGCGISILGLTLTLISYSLFRCLNREKSGKILMNLSTSMLIMNVVFVVGSESSLSLSGDVVCKAVAILLHYFLLSTIAWMLVEAINMYQALITVFAKYSGFFMLKRCFFAWGAPALIVIITAAVDIDNYKTSTSLCFLSQGNQVAFFVALLSPACLVLLINFAIFIMVSRVILRPKFKGQVNASSDSLNPAQIRGAFTVMTLLGVTWVFGPLAINEAKLVINYLFTILNSLQGFLIFVFRCCFNPEVRMSWVLLVKTGKFKRRKGPLSAYTSDTSSKVDSGKMNGSYADAVKPNMFNSLGKPKHTLNNDKNLDTKNTKNTNLQSKTSKDIPDYYDDFKQYNGDKGRNSSMSTQSSRLYNRNSDQNDRMDHGLRNSGFYPRNGHRLSESSSRDDNVVRSRSELDLRYSGRWESGSDYNRNSSDHGSNGLVTIYTGKYNEAHRSSGFLASRLDEFTRL